MNERFEHKKSLGQHFLNSEYVPKIMCDAASLEKGDLVVEIGPGTGILTKEILKRGASVIAVEADPRAIASLEGTFTEEIAQQRLTIIHADARKLNLASLGVQPNKYKVVANIPYYISGLLFRTFLDSDIQPSTLVFLVQKELAERIARDPKESLLSLSVKVFGDVSYVSTIKRGHFTPPPKVDSAIVAVTNINDDFFKNIEKSLFFNVIKAGFASKRKQLAPNLKAIYPPTITKEALVNINLSEASRAEDLSLSDWDQLLTQLQSTDLHT
jgi:16S rRNA (adenine1518-N6/adenine1519-N6)-dimethyltransferase